MHVLKMMRKELQHCKSIASCEGVYISSRRLNYISNNTPKGLHRTLGIIFFQLTASIGQTSKPKMTFRITSNPSKKFIWNFKISLAKHHSSLQYIYTVHIHMHSTYGTAQAQRHTLSH